MWDEDRNSWVAFDASLHLVELDEALNSTFVTGKTETSLPLRIERRMKVEGKARNEADVLADLLRKLGTPIQRVRYGTHLDGDAHGTYEIHFPSASGAQFQQRFLGIIFFHNSGAADPTVHRLRSRINGVDIPKCAYQRWRSKIDLDMELLGFPEVDFATVLSRLQEHMSLCGPTVHHKLTDFGAAT